MQNSTHKEFTGSEGQLAVDVLESKDIIVIRAAIAGVSASDLDVHVTNDIVTIRGERRSGREIQNATAHFEECFWGTFSRSIVLPHHVKPDEADAVIEAGILTLTLPKSHGDMQVKVREVL